MTLILNKEDQEHMRAAGRFNAQLMDAVRPMVVVGTTLEEINQFVHQYTIDHGHTPAPLNYKGFPKSCCISVNNVICHGIPNHYVLRDGDIVNVDLTTIVDGWHGDSSETFLIGNVNDEAKRLVQCSFDCLYKGIDAITPGGQVKSIGFAIIGHANIRGFGVVRQFIGHGIGRRFHQDPQIPHYPHAQLGAFVIQPGMCFTIEPMINAGKVDVVIDQQDGWTARTVDGKLSAQFEHTILMTENGPEILTLTKDGPQKGYKF